MSKEDAHKTRHQIVCKYAEQIHLHLRHHWTTNGYTTESIREWKTIEERILSQRDAELEPVLAYL